MWGVAQLENFRLKVFRTVAQHLSFRKAAEHLFITQPAVTLQIKALEEDLGVRLFDRRGNQIFLTAQGTRLLGYAKQMEALVAEAEQDIAEGEGQLSGELALGASTTIAQYVLPRLIGAFPAGKSPRPAVAAKREHRTNRAAADRRRDCAGIDRGAGSASRGAHGAVHGRRNGADRAGQRRN